MLRRPTSIPRIVLKDDVSGNNLIDPTRFNFGPFQYNSAWASKVYDNEMVDSNGDGWFGEDVGKDGLFARTVNDTVRYFGTFKGIYLGPDSGEADGHLNYGEDLIYRPEFIFDPRYGELNIGYTMGNGILDPGDGIPDFRGPPLAAHSGNARYHVYGTRRCRV